MKKGDKVFVNWPTGKGGPYKVDDKDTTQDRIWIKTDTNFWLVDREDIELVEPEIEEGRLVHGDIIEDGHKITIYGRYYRNEPIADCFNIKPVHRRWYELSIDEIKELGKGFSLGTIKKKYLEIYKLITGEDHP